MTDINKYMQPFNNNNPELFQFDQLKIESEVNQAQLILLLKQMVRQTKENSEKKAKAQ